jgi:uncharacterized protein (TIGR00297 family)
MDSVYSLNSRSRLNLAWQSKLVLLLVLPFAGVSVVLQTHWWGVYSPSVAIWTLGLSLLLGLVVLKLRAATPAAAVTGVLITASLMFSTLAFPYRPWSTALVPVLAVSLLAHFATRIGRAKKEHLGTAEPKHGRAASQVAANLGFAAVVSDQMTQSWLATAHWIPRVALAPHHFLAVGLAALAEAAADTVSSELGQVFGGRPRMITNLRLAEPGQDGAISFAGTLAGVVAAAIVSALGTLALSGDRTIFAVSCAGGIFGLLFDSLLGATLEQRGWLNNDAVNFLSTTSAAAFGLGLLAVLPHLSAG